MHMVKRWLTPPPSMTDQDLTYNFKVPIQHAHGQTMIDPPVWQTRSMDLASNWPWRTLLHERPFTRQGNYLVLNIKDMHEW